MAKKKTITKREAELLLSGELQKAIWAYMWRVKEQRINVIVEKTGYPYKSVHQSLNTLKSLDLVENNIRGVYSVSGRVVK